MRAQTSLVFSLALAGCYPEFRFADKSGTGGSDGGGGTSSSVSSSTSTTSAGDAGGAGGQGGTDMTTIASTSEASSSTGMPPVATVFCGPPTPELVECPPTQACCFNRENGALDVCTSSTACDNGTYITFSCDGPEDCGANVCCGDVKLINMANTFQESRCLPSCPAPSRKLCHTDDDCPPGKACEELLTTPIAGLNYGVGVDAYANYFRWCAL
jgi:hypothetical protein